jgi:flagellar hook assembly protein FlgD
MSKDQYNVFVEELEKNKTIYQNKKKDLISELDTFFKIIMIPLMRGGIGLERGMSILVSLVRLNTDMSDNDVIGTVGMLLEAKMSNNKKFYKEYDEILQSVSKAPDAEALAQAEIVSMAVKIHALSTTYKQFTQSGNKQLTEAIKKYNAKAQAQAQAQAPAQVNANIGKPEGGRKTIAAKTAKTAKTAKAVKTAKTAKTAKNATKKRNRLKK